MDKLSSFEAIVVLHNSFQQINRMLFTGHADNTLLILSNAHTFLKQKCQSILNNPIIFYRYYDSLHRKQKKNSHILIM